MLKVFFFALLFSGYWAYSQELSSKLSVDSLENTDLAIVSNKKESGLYNLKKGEFVKDLSKNFYYYAEKVKILFEVSPENTISAFYINYENELLGFKSRKNELNIFFESDNYSNNAFISDNETHIDLYSEEYFTLEDNLEFRIDNNDEFVGIKILDQKNQILINDFFYEDKIIVDLPYVGIDGYDSVRTINGLNEYVYPPDEIIPAVSKSGVYDLKDKEWKINPIHGAIREIDGNVLIAANFEEGYTASYDFYSLASDGNWVSMKKNVKSNDEIPYIEIFGKDAYYVCQDKEFIGFKKNEKWGLIHFNLFSKYNANVLYGFLPDFNFDIVFTNEYDMVQAIGEREVRLYAQNDSIIKVARYDGDLIYKITKKITTSYKENMTSFYSDQEFYIDGEAYKMNYETQDSCYDLGIICLEPIAEKEINIRQSEKVFMALSENYVYIQHIEPQGPLEEIALIDYYGFDSIDASGNLVFYPPDPGYYATGIFDLKTKTWFLKPEHLWAIQTYDGFLVCSPILDKNGLLIGENYSLKKLDGLYEFYNVSDTEFYTDDQYLKYRIPNYKVDSVFNAGNQNPSWGNRKTVYFLSGEKIGMANLELNEVCIEPKDYVLANPYTSYYLFIDQNELYISLDDTSLSLSISDIKHLEASGTNYYSSNYIKIETKSGSINYYMMNEESRNIEKLSESDYTQGRMNSDNDLNFSLTAINDSLLAITDIMKDYISDMPLFDQFGFDSIIYDAETGLDQTVYPPNDPGYNRSGVYNLNAKTWLIPAKYKWVYKFENEYLTKNEYPEAGKTDQTALYSIYALDGEMLQSNIKKEDLEPSYLEFIKTVEE